MLRIATLLVLALLLQAPKKSFGAKYTLAKKDSIIVYYHPNGKVKEKEVYTNGQKNGKWRTYNENGVLLKVIKYKKGVFWWERQYKNGKLIKIIDKKGKEHKMKNCGC